MVQTTKEILQRIKGSDSAHKITSLLLTQHVTLNTTTGSSPAELLMGRCLWTFLERDNPEFSHEMMDQQKSKGIHTAPRRYSSVAETIDPPCNPLGSDVGVSPDVEVSPQTKDSPEAPSLSNPNEEAGFKGFSPPLNLLDQDVPHVEMNDR
ncbi:hypothetical protein PR048_009538 [Dryococelus australis]|uniref:Uncharacterized protein n=1 Tax=Dryococelus australis TaxID=614101 RepID=A0ABQ9I0J9_9NEOP|nr:hypothetical protein PR048_009538 [Dryococelus australis]